MEEIKLPDLASVLGSNLGLNQKSSRLFIDTFIDSLRTSLLGYPKVIVPHLGVFTASFDVEGVPSSERLDLSEDVAMRLSTPSYQVRDILGALSGFIREELLNGKRLVLNDIGSLEFRCGRPRADQNTAAPESLRQGAQRALPPSDTNMIFQPEPVLMQTGNFRELTFTMAEEFKEELIRTPFCFIHVVSPQKDFFVDTLAYYFGQAGWTVDVSTTVANAMMKIEPERTYLVIVDATVGDARNFIRTMKLNRQTNRIPLVVLYGAEEEYEHPAEVMVLGDATVYQPFDMRQVITAANLQILEAYRADRAERTSVQVQLPTDTDKVAECVALLTRLLSESGMVEESQVAITAAFREALSNAARHGNQMDRDSKILIHYAQDHEKVQITVKDRGKGFDYARILRHAEGTQETITTLRQKSAADRKGGLGITLMQKCSDALEFHTPGNAVTLVKYLQPQKSETTEIEIAV